MLCLGVLPWHPLRLGGFSLFFPSFPAVGARSRGRLVAIPCSAHCLDRVAAGAELLAQPPDVDVHDVGLRILIDTLDGAQDALAREDLARVGQEQAQDIPLLRRQLHGLVRTPDIERAGIEAERARRRAPPSDPRASPVWRCAGQGPPCGRSARQSQRVWRGNRRRPSAVPRRVLRARATAERWHQNNERQTGVFPWCPLRLGGFSLFLPLRSVLLSPAPGWPPRPLRFNAPQNCRTLISRI